MINGADVNIFDSAYATRSPVFGENPTQCVVDAEVLLNRNSVIIDLGCGDGRDTVYLLSKGHAVYAIDYSFQGIAALHRRALAAGVERCLKTSVISVEAWEPLVESVDAVIGITILDHVALDVHENIFANIEKVIRRGGFVVLEMHSDRDPSFCGSDKSVSEFSSAIRSHSSANYLLSRFFNEWRVIYYSDRVELDFDHGPTHVHGFSTLIAQKA